MRDDRIPDSLWERIKRFGLLILAILFGCFVAPYYVISELLAFCGPSLNVCKSLGQYQWLVSLTINAILPLVVFAILLWVCSDLIAQYRQALVERTSMSPNSVRRCVRVTLGLWLALIFAMSAFIQRTSVPDVAKVFKEIRKGYESDANAFDALALQLEKDPQISMLYCERSGVRAVTPNQPEFDGRADYYTNRYGALCQFEEKLVVQRTERGVSIERRFFEVNALLVSGYLEWRRNPTDLLTTCPVNGLAGDSGACDMRIDDSWSAMYLWEPFCLDSMEGELGC